ncbi:hypothetical protein H310_03225 [Aphanomyces invadans]|uniref:HECT-type E3 ubiquitin transferase n=1 Tax=Aphanomyces invadans TaxID=157072 RepID=A0A024UHY6_9STRA|nr:hypothetical protein H310_03225 [Aphanomyces invadans]ETW05462.1 hypothetical protein H310_03225 [Aphanomyces invadans]|eukprot:XP_008865239.1 hypothetical protein H310_03225 [Aphanomyces invadans]
MNSTGNALSVVLVTALALVFAGMTLYWHRHRVIAFIYNCRRSVARSAEMPAAQYRAFLDNSHLVDEWLCWVCYHKNQHQNQSCAMCRSDFEPDWHKSIILTSTTLASGPRESTISATQQRIRNRHLWKRSAGSSPPSRDFVHWVHTPVLDITDLLQDVLPDGTALSISLDGPAASFDNSALSASSVAYVREARGPGMSSAWVPATSVQWSTTIYTDAMKDLSWDQIHSMATQPFSAKVSWFNQALHSLSLDHVTGYSLVSVHRAEALESSMRQLLAIPPTSMRQHLQIEFHNEPAVDAGGGVLREWFGLVTRQLFGGRWFEPTHTPDITYWFAQTSDDDSSCQMFKFAGRVVAKAIQDGHCLSVHLAIPLWKHVLGIPMTWHDLVHLDTDLHQSIAWVVDHSDAHELGLDFTMRGVPLIAGGDCMSVTDANKHEYVAAIVRFLFYDAVHGPLEAFLEGFQAVLPVPLLHVFDAFEMDLILCGHDDINATDWQLHTTVEYLATSQLKRRGGKHGSQQQDVVDWFWLTVHSYSQVQKAKLLQFVTGSSRPPVEGFRALTSSNGLVCPFTIALSTATSKFPVAMTCFNRISLPLYRSQAELQEYLTVVISMDVTGFTMR